VTGVCRTVVALHVHVRASLLGCEPQAVQAINVEATQMKVILVMPGRDRRAAM